MSKLNVNCSCLLISSAFDIGVMLYLECDACSVFTTDFKIVTFSQRAHWSRVIDNIDMKSVCKSYREITEMEKTIDSKTFIKFISGYALLRFQAMVHFTVQRPNIYFSFVFQWVQNLLPFETICIAAWWKRRKKKSNQIRNPNSNSDWKIEINALRLAKDSMGSMIQAIKFYWKWIYRKHLIFDVWRYCGRLMNRATMYNYNESFACRRQKTLSEAYWNPLSIELKYWAGGWMNLVPKIPSREILWPDRLDGIN